MHEVAVDVEDVQPVTELGHDVLVPDLVDERATSHTNCGHNRPPRARAPAIVPLWTPPSKAACPGHEGGDVPGAPADEPGTAAGQVVDDGREGRPDRRQGNEVDIGTLPGKQHPAVVEADQCCGIGALLFHDRLDRQTQVRRSVATPVAEEKRRVVEVGDHRAVGPTIGEARDGAGMYEHLVGRPQVAVDVVRDGHVDDPAARHDVVGEVRHRDPGRCGSLGQGLRRLLVVARRVGELEGPGEAGYEVRLTP